MQIKTARQPVMGIAALLILIYHLFPIPRTGGVGSGMIRAAIASSYIGVDIFVFLSGYSVSFSKTDPYLPYIRKRCLRLYPVFILSIVCALLLKQMDFPRALLTVTGLDLFLSGGGSFLWFIPAVMIFYLIAPVLTKLFKRFGSKRALAGSLFVWAALVYIVEEAGRLSGAGIFLMRLPVFLIGLFASDYEGRWKSGYTLAAGLMLLVPGVYLVTKYGSLHQINEPLTDLYYVLAIPLVLGLVLLLSLLFQTCRPSFLSFIGGLTLELYCFQMVFGSFFYEAVYFVTRSKMLSFLAAAAALILLSFSIKTLAGRLITGRKGRKAHV